MKIKTRVWDKELKDWSKDTHAVLPDGSLMFDCAEKEWQTPADPDRFALVVGLVIGDNEGIQIWTGDIVKKPTNCNQELHGTYALYEVALQGLTPVIKYITSEKGRMLPYGYTGCVLSDEYDNKNFVFTLKPERLHALELEVIGNIYQNPELLEKAA